MSIQEEEEELRQNQRLQQEHNEKMADGFIDDFNDPTDLPVQRSTKPAAPKRKGQRQRKKAKK